MMNELNQTINRVNTLQSTENGALGYSTTGMEIVDLNCQVPARHNNVTTENIEMFVKSFEKDPVYTIKWMFYLRDVREGLGERDSFIKLFMTLYNTHSEIAMKILHLIPEFGRWKDVIDILSLVDDNSPLAEKIYHLINNQLKDDCSNLMIGNSISLLAKWLPSVNASKKARKLAFRITHNEEINISFAVYRKMLSKLRSHLDVTEVKTCGNKWGDINYNGVSSNANKRYAKSFLTHDEERRKEYLQELLSPEKNNGVKMNASNLYPHEVYNMYSHPARIGYRYKNVKNDPSIEALWKNLKDMSTIGDTLMVCDGSSSMTTTVDHLSQTKAIDVSRALSIYFAERCHGEYKNKVIEFSETPSFIDLSNCESLADKFNTMIHYAKNARNTNLELVFNLILKTAVRNSLPQSEIPARILIVSDCEFDRQCAGGLTPKEYSSYGYFTHHSHPSEEQFKTLMDTIREKWESAGYIMPQLVFWNVNSRTNTTQAKFNDAGVILMSGFSVNNIKLVLSGEVNPWNALKKVLDSDRYKVIDEVINSEV